MTRAAMALLVGAAALALVDWAGSADKRLRRLRYVSKPGTIVLLVAAALLLHPTHELQRDAFVVALVLSLFGDVYLLLPEKWFLPGLAMFLMAHLAYSAGFIAAGPRPAFVAVAIPLVAALALLTGRPVIRGNRARGNPVPAPAVWGYLMAISAMLALAAASGRWTALAGAALFYVSDAMIARDRFVDPMPRARLPIIVTYHLGQGLLVLSLV